jgi:hypothetical protein
MMNGATTPLGGDLEPASLLCKENEIVKHATTLGFSRSADTSEGFLVELFHPPYPDYDKGVAVYAGHHHEYGRLPPLSALNTSRPPLYETVEQRLAAENFEVQDEFQKYLARLGTEIDASLQAGMMLFRARIGVARRFISGFGGLTADTVPTIHRCRNRRTAAGESNARQAESGRRVVSLSGDRRSDGGR